MYHSIFHYFSTVYSLLAVLQESIEQYGIKQRSSSVFQASPNIQRKKGSKKKKTKRSAS